MIENYNEISECIEDLIESIQRLENVNYKGDLVNAVYNLAETHYGILIEDKN